MGSRVLNAQECARRRHVRPAAKANQKCANEPEMTALLFELTMRQCSGERPRCGACIDRGSKCHYVSTTAKTRLKALKQRCDELESQRSPYEELFELLRSASERDARDILAKVRSGADVETLLSHVANGDLLLQLSVIPETRYRYEFPYISRMPESLLASDNPYLPSYIFEAAAVYPSIKQPDARTGGSRPPNSSSGSKVTPPSQERGFAAYEPAYLKPFHAAEVVDAGLSDVKISSWTSVCRDNVLMRNLLSRWLQCEYQFTAAFQKNLFLEDMAARREDFCSSLLVNVILGYACVCCSQFSNRAEYWNPHTWTYRFIAEAKRLWELEAMKPRLTTIQAGILFNVFHNLCGLDEVGQAYRIQAITLAHSMRLFDSAVEVHRPRTRQGMAFTAWSLFNWETLVGFSFRFAPLLKDPPDWRLPDPSEEPGWYGEIRLRYPLSNRLLPSYFGQVFRARSEFRVIMNDACQAAYGTDSELTLGEAHDFLSRLEGWFDGLPAPLSPKSIVLPGHLQLHMYYHHLILTIFKPLVDAKTNQEPSPQEIVADANRHLHTLIRIYYLRHGYEAMDLFIVIPLMLAASDCIDAIDDQTPPAALEAWRSTLILATKGLYTQRRNHYLAEALFRVIRGRMRPSEVALFRGIMNVEGNPVDEKPDMAQAVRSHWPVSVVKKKEDVDSCILKNLVEDYAHLNIKEEISDDEDTARARKS